MLKNILYATLSALLLSGTALAAPEVSLLSKDWGVMCEEDVFDEEVPFECFMLSSGSTDMVLGIERDPFNNLQIRFIEKSVDAETTEIMAKIDIGVFMKIDKGDLIKTQALYTKRNDTHSQMTPGFDAAELLQLMAKMKEGTNLNLKLDVIGNEFIDKFSLSGFTKAYNHMLKKDVRRSDTEKAQPN